MERFSLFLLSAILITVFSCTRYERYGAAGLKRMPDEIVEITYYGFDGTQTGRTYYVTFDFLHSNRFYQDLNSSGELVTTLAYHYLMDEYGNYIGNRHSLYPYNLETNSPDYRICYEENLYYSSSTKYYYIKRWNETLNEWENYEAWRLSYNNDDKVVSAVQSLFNDDGLETETIRIDYAYNSNGHLTLEQYTNLNSLEPEEKIEYEYDPESRITTRSRYMYNDGAWVKSYKYEYSYYKGDQRSEYAYSVGDPETNTWVPYFKDVYARDSDGLLQLIMSYYWNSEPGNWTEDSKTEYHYSDPRFDRVITVYNWDGNAGDWVIDYKYEQEVFTDDLIITTDYDCSEGTFFFNGKTEYKVIFRKE